MENKVLQKKVKVKERRRKHKQEVSGISSTSCCFSSSMGQNLKCYNKAAEFICSACLLCVCCPLSVMWCCIKQPCKIGWHAARSARNGACCGSEKRVFAAYSSFSDIESDPLPGKADTCSKNLGAPKSRMAGRPMSLN